MEKMAILPFADYSHQASFNSALTWGGNKRLVGEIKDYLSSYIKRIENRISSYTPVSENPTRTILAVSIVVEVIDWGVLEFSHFIFILLPPPII